MIEVEGQIDKILFSRVFQLGDADEELIIFVIIKALHPSGKIIQFVQIGKAVFQHEKFLRPIDLRHKSRLRSIPPLDCVYLCQLCIQLALTDRETDINFVIAVLDSDFNHGALTFHRK